LKRLFTKRALDLLVLVAIPRQASARCGPPWVVWP
jgi:hypothetical protein